MADRVLGYLSTAILFLDDRLNILFANQASETLLEESYAHMEGRQLTEIIGNGSDLALVIRAAVDSNKLITRRQMPLVLGPGRHVTADVTVTPIAENQDGEQNQVLVELIPMDRYLRIDRDAAIKEHHDVTRQMVRGFAHEVKNPLGGIKGSAQLLSRELPDAGLQE